MVAHPEALVQLRDLDFADVEGLMDHRRQHRSIRVGEDVKVRRSRQAVACRKRCDVELGKPGPAPNRKEKNMNARTTDIKAQKRKLGTGAKQQSTRSWKPELGQAENSRMPSGCLIRHSTQRMGKP